MNQHRETLMMYRLSSARQKIHAANILLEAGEYKDSISRSYYAMFTGVRAILANEEIDFKKHSAVIGYFQREYVKSGKVATKYSKYLSGAFQIRNLCDYEDFFIAYKEDAEDQYVKAKEFVDMIEFYVEENLKTD